MTQGVGTPTPDPDFVHDWPASRVLFGPGQLAAVPAEVERLGAQRALVIGDPAAKAATEEIVELLGAVRVADRIDEVVMHVPSPLAAEAAERATESGADVVLCAGGGSSTGLAKAVAKFTGLPVLAVPTTYAGSEMTSIWGLTDDGRKVTGRLQAVRPRTVVYDPVLTVSLPVGLSVTSGLNAVAHCVEALYSPRPSPLASAAAAEGVRAMGAALAGLHADPADLAARGLALRGAWLAGWALEVSEMGLHHRLCHVLGGLLDLPHAPLHAVVLPYVSALTAPEAPEAMQLLAAGLTAGAGSAVEPVDAGGALWDVNRRFGAPTSLPAIGMAEADLGRAVAAATESLRERPVVHPGTTDWAAAEAVITAAWTGRRPTPGLFPR